MLQSSRHLWERRKHGLRSPHVWSAGAWLPPSRYLWQRRKHGLRSPQPSDTDIVQPVGEHGNLQKDAGGEAQLRTSGAKQGLGHVER
jgi:hypothetical protein